MNIPPNNISIEEGCLGCAYLSKKALTKLLEETNADDFYFEKCREVYKCFLYFYKQGLEIDIILLNQKVKHPEITLEWLIGLGNITTSDKIDSYIKELLELSQARRILQTSIEMQDGIQKENDASGIINETIDKLKEISANQLYNVTTLKEMETGDIYDLGNDKAVRKTGFAELDKMLWGIGAGLIILAAQTSHGKSAITGNMAVNIAKKYDDYVLWFTLEMTKQQMRRRFVSQEAQVDNLLIKMKKLNQENIEKVTHGMKVVDDLPIALASNKNNINDIIINSRRFSHKQNISLIVVDYLQLVQCFIQGATLAQIIGKIVNDLKALAEELEIPVICLSQFSRKSDKNEYPDLSWLKESSTIEQAADMVWFLHRYTEKQKEKEFSGDYKFDIENLFRFIVAKNRDGKANFHVDMEFVPEYTCFKEV